MRDVTGGPQSWPEFLPDFQVFLPGYTGQPGDEHDGDDNCPVCRILAGVPPVAALADGTTVHELDEGFLGLMGLTNGDN